MNLRFFDIDSLDDQVPEPPVETPGGILTEEFLSLHMERVEKIKRLSCNLPDPGKIIFLWTINSFNAFTFIPYILSERAVIDEMIISTYSINIRIIDALIRLIDQGKIAGVDLFISDSIRSRSPQVYFHLIAQVEKRSRILRVHYAWNHSKIALIRCGQDYFDVEGSGNWAENALHEQYIFLNSQRVFEFRKNEILHGSITGTD